MRAAAELARGTVRGAHGCRVGAGARLLTPNGDIRLGEGTRIGPRTEVVACGSPDGGAGLFVLGDHSRIGARCLIQCAELVEIGRETEVSWNVQILDTDFHSLYESDGTVRAHTAPIRVGDHVLIGTGAIVLKGVTLGDGVVVAAGSVVTRSVDPGTLVAGNPARPIREISDWR